MYGLGLSVGNLASKSALSSAFDPLLLSGLLAWYSPDDVVVDGSNNITQANDKTGNGHHMVVESGANGPSLVGTGFGGAKTAFLFEASNSEYLVNNSLAAAIQNAADAQPFTYVYVMGYGDGYFPGSFDTPFSVSRDSTMSTWRFWPGYNSIVSYPRLTIQANGSSNSNLGDDSEDFWRNNASAVIVYTYDGAELTVWRDGVKGTSPVTVAIGDFMDLDVACLGARWQPSSIGGVVAHWNGHMGDYFFSNAYCTDEEIAALSEYLMTKFGITA